MQVQKDCVKDLLPHGRLLLEQFGLKGGGACTMTRLESMEGSMEVNGYDNVVI